MTDPTASSDDNQDEPNKLGPLQVAGSAIAAAFGVQSRKNRERDFSRGKISHFVVAGVVFTIVFVLVLLGVVAFVTS